MLPWVVLFQAVACAFLCGLVAKEKNRDVGAWVGAGFFLGVLALIAISGMPVAIERQPKPTKPTTDSIIRDAVEWRRQREAEKLKRWGDQPEPPQS